MLKLLSCLFLFCSHCCVVHANVVNYDKSTGTYQVDKYGANVFAPDTKKKTDVFSAHEPKKVIPENILEKFSYPNGK